MTHAIVPEKRLAALMRAIDALAKAEEDYLAGRIPYSKYAAATDRVVRERDKVGLQSMRITRR